MTPHSSEQAMGLREAAEWIARHTGAPVPNHSTVNRWVVHGVRGVRLQAKRVGAKYWTTPSDVARFLDQLNDSRGGERPVEGTDSQPAFQQVVRRRQIDAACARLDGLCAGFEGGAGPAKDKTRMARTVPGEEMRFRPPGAIGGSVF